MPPSIAEATGGGDVRGRVSATIALRCEVLGRAPPRTIAGQQHWDATITAPTLLAGVGLITQPEERAHGTTASGSAPRGASIQNVPRGSNRLLH